MTNPTTLSPSLDVIELCYSIQSAGPDVVLLDVEDIPLDEEVTSTGISTMMSVDALLLPDGVFCIFDVNCTCYQLHNHRYNSIRDSS